MQPSCTPTTSQPSCTPTTSQPTATQPPPQVDTSSQPAVSELSSFTSTQPGLTQPNSTHLDLTQATNVQRITLLVTKGLTPPSTPLDTETLEHRISSLAAKDSRKGLVDEGGKMSLTSDQLVLATGHYNGFISAVCAAFANHFPLALKPQHIWLLILQGVAKHVELNAEAVRSKWVAHEGKKELLVQRNHFVQGQPNDWASVIDAPDGFAAQIDKNIVDGVAEALAPSFSATTPTELIAQKITVMDITKSFFSYKCMTMCGFPTVTLEGTPNDWHLLRVNAEKLISERCARDWGQRWLAALLPLLDKINEEYASGLNGSVGDEPFWNSMCKRGGTSGSGSRTWFNGWFNILFPYILEQPNRYCIPYSPTNEYVQEGRDGGRYGMGAPPGVQGPDVADFPPGIAKAPVVWDYYGKEIKLQFKAGFVGAMQDPESCTVTPCVGWYIAHEGGNESVMDKMDPF